MRTTIRSVKLVGTLALALSSLALFGCGDDDESTTSTPAGQVVDVAAAPDNTLAFEQKELTAKPGEATFVLNNPAQISHDFCIEDPDGKEVGCSELVAEGETQLSADLKPGKYVFYCDIAGHRDGGMEGPLTVK